MVDKGNKQLYREWKKDLLESENEPRHRQHKATAQPGGCEGRSGEAWRMNNDNFMMFRILKIDLGLRLERKRLELLRHEYKIAARTNIPESILIKSRRQLFIHFIRY